MVTAPARSAASTATAESPVVMRTSNTVNVDRVAQEEVMQVFQHAYTIGDGIHRKLCTALTTVRRSGYARIGEGWAVA